MANKEINTKTNKENAKSDEKEVKEVKSNSNKLNLLKNKRVVNSILIVILVGLLAALLYTYKDLFMAATVNGQPITRIDVIKELEKQGGKQALDTLVTKKLVAQEAKEKNIKVSEDDLNKELDKFKSLITQQGQTLEQFLLFQNITEEDLREEIKLRLVLKRLLEDKVKVTDKEVNEYIESNKDMLPQEESSDELKDNIKEQLKNQKLNQEIQSYIQDLKKDANINYFKEY